MKHVARGVAAALLLLVSVGASAPGAGAAAAAVGQADGWHLDIDRALEAIGLTTGMVVGEAGAGDGYFTFPMARKVGPAGVVLANDISTRALSSLDRRRASEQVANIQTVVGAVDDPRFPRHDLQMIVVVHAFHDFSSPVEWLVNAKKYLRPGATLAIIDKDPAQGAEAHFWPRERIVGYARDAGFVLVKAVDVNSAHLVLVFTTAAHTMTESQRAKLDAFLRQAVDDRRPEMLSVIVRVSAGDGAGARMGELLARRGLKVGSTLSDGRLVVVTLTADHLPALAESPDVAHVSFDAFVKPLAR